MDEENPEEYRKGGYHKVLIGDIYKNRYHVVSKLGWGYFSTVWLCWDSETNGFVAMKVQKSASQYKDAAMDEIEILTILRNTEDANKNYVVQLVDFFEHQGPNGKHVCMVFEHLGENLLSLIRKHDFRGLPLPLVKTISRNILLGLQYIHSKNIINTDLKPENILMTAPSCTTKNFIENFKPPSKTANPTENKLKNIDNLTKAQKKRLKKKLKKSADATKSGNGNEDDSGDESENNDNDNDTQSNNNNNATVASEEQTNTGAKISYSTNPNAPLKGGSKKLIASAEEKKYIQEQIELYGVKIVDFGNACWVEKQFTQDIQTRQYRSPEVIIGAGYSTSADIWSLACVIFELITGDYLFDPKSNRDYNRDEDHLAQAMELLGKIPKHVALSGKFSSALFTTKGELKNIKSLNFWALEDVLMEKYRLSEENAAFLASFLVPMLDFDPTRRATAAQCLDHPFLSFEGVPKVIAPQAQVNNQNNEQEDSAVEQITRAFRAVDVANSSEEADALVRKMEDLTQKLENVDLSALHNLERLTLAATNLHAALTKNILSKNA